MLQISDEPGGYWVETSDIEDAVWEAMNNGRAMIGTYLITYAGATGWAVQRAGIIPEEEQ